MKVGHVTERTDASSASSFLDSDELERTGIDLGTTGRLQLMARLAEGESSIELLIYHSGRKEI
jgi:RNA-binding protein 39